MNKRVTISAVMAAMLMSGNAFAYQPGSAYGGVQFSSFDFSIDGSPEDFSPTGLIGRIGSHINENFSVEGRLGVGVSDDELTASDGIDTVSVSIEVDTLIGVYGVGHIMLNESSSVYVLVGYTKADIAVSASVSGLGSVSTSEDESDLSFGVGADIGVGDNMALNIEYVQYLSESDFDLNAISVGVKFSF